MKCLLIIIFSSAVIFVIAIIIEIYSDDVTAADIASMVKDIAGIVLVMLTLWFIYCVVC